MGCGLRFVVKCLLFVVAVCCELRVGGCSLIFVCCLLFVNGVLVRCWCCGWCYLLLCTVLLYVVRRSLSVARCWLFVVGVVG